MSRWHDTRAAAVSGRKLAILLGILVLIVSGFALLFTAPASASAYWAIHDGPRYQWDNANGYCGECSLQVAGIEMGFWVSQDQARKLAEGEALLGAGENYDTMLNKLHLQHVNYPEISGTLTDRQNFIMWMRDGMVAGDPVVFGVKIHGDWGGDPYYDHIICAYYANGATSGYNGADTLGYSDHYGSMSAYTFNQWRDGWQNSNQEYYLPENGVQQFGTRITGMEGDNETLPISLTVPLKTEPSVTLGKSPVSMNATVNMRGLTVGTTYCLLRWNATSSTIGSVPFSNLLASATAANIEYQFTAVSSTASRAVSFMSNGITIFRLVPGQGSGPADPTTVPCTSLRGLDRYDTAIKISQAAFPGALPAGSGLVLAPGVSFPEALCGAPLATAYGGPVLLCSKTTLYSNVRTELQRLAPRYVFCIGMTTDLVDQVRAALPAATVTPINGALNSIYDMSRIVAKALEDKVGDLSGATAIITIGTSFPDAIGAGPLACAKLWPIILTNNVAGALNASALAALSDLGIAKAIKVGTYATLPGTVTGLANLSGANRYITNANLADWAKTNAGLSFSHIGLATGDKFPDALASGPYLAADDGILLLSPLLGPLPPVIAALITANQAAVQHVSFIACIEPVIGQMKACLP